MSTKQEREKELRRAYEKLPHRMESRRKKSSARAHEGRVFTTMNRLETHTEEEMLRIIIAKCDAHGLDYGANINVYRALALALINPNPHLKTGISTSISENTTSVDS